MRAVSGLKATQLTNRMKDYLMLSINDIKST
jgi:hypothetical protein